MMKVNIKETKSQVEEIAKRHNLKLVILYGSQATGKDGEKSDIDIAVLGIEPVRFEEEVDLINEFTDLFKTDDIDVKSLHGAGPLFRYQVMRDGLLLYGDRYDYDSFKAYAFRDFCDSQDLFRLKEILIKKRLQQLKSR